MPIPTDVVYRLIPKDKRVSINDCVGKTFGRLTVLEICERGRTAKVRCQCKCGKVKVIDWQRVRDGTTVSCRCFSKERMSKGYPTRTQTYNIWVCMKNRCTPGNVANKIAFRSYGDVSVCPRWLGGDGYTNFLADMGERPAGMSLDRIDPKGNYEPANCRWATPSQQQGNKRKTKWILLDGKRINAHELAELAGVSYMVAWHYVDRLHRPILEGKLQEFLRGKSITLPS